MVSDIFDQGAIVRSEHLCRKVYNTTPSTDKYVRVGKVERTEDALQSILKVKKIDGG